MGYVRNHVILVTGTYGEFINDAHAKAKAIFPQVSEIIFATVNTSATFMIPPDGSKERWPESNEGDRQRADFKKWLNSIRHRDGYSPLDWVELYYGGDDECPAIVSHSDFRFGK